MSWPLPEDEDERMSTLRSLELSAARVPQSAPPRRASRETQRAAQARHAAAPGIRAHHGALRIGAERAHLPRFIGRRAAPVVPVEQRFGRYAGDRKRNSLLRPFHHARRDDARPQGDHGRARRVS